MADPFDLADFEDPCELDDKRIARAIRKAQRRDAAWCIAELEQCYLRERNPLYALEAIWVAYLFALPVPRWAVRLIALAPSVEELRNVVSAGTPASALT